MNRDEESASSGLKSASLLPTLGPLLAAPISPLFATSAEGAMFPNITNLAAGDSSSSNNNPNSLSNLMNPSQEISPGVSGAAVTAAAHVPLPTISHLPDNFKMVDPFYEPLFECQLNGTTATTKNNDKSSNGNNTVAESIPGIGNFGSIEDVWNTSFPSMKMDSTGFSTPNPFDIGDFVNETGFGGTPLNAYNVLGSGTGSIPGANYNGAVPASPGAILSALLPSNRLTPPLPLNANQFAGGFLQQNAMYPTGPAYNPSSHNSNNNSNNKNATWMNNGAYSHYNNAGLQYPLTGTTSGTNTYPSAAISASSSSLAYPDRRNLYGVSSGPVRQQPPNNHPYFNSNNNNRSSKSSIRSVIRTESPGDASSDDKPNSRRKKNCPRVSKENRVCSDCFTRETPIWRYSDDGRLLCNACGVYAKKNKQKRSVDSLKRKRPNGGRPDDLQSQDSSNSNSNIAMLHYGGVGVGNAAANLAHLANGSMFSPPF